MKLNSAFAPARALALSLSLAFGVPGCAITPPDVVSGEPAAKLSRSEMPRTQRSREAAMNREWQNRPLAELEKTYGKPNMIINIPGEGGPRQYAVVYTQDVGSGCIDSFAVTHADTPVVSRYVCR